MAFTLFPHLPSSLIHKRIWNPDPIRWLYWDISLPSAQVVLLTSTPHFWFISLSCNKQGSLYSVTNRLIVMIILQYIQIQKHYNCIAATATAAKSPQSCPTLCDPIEGSPPGSPIHGILQARILEWVSMSFSRGPSRFRTPTRISSISCMGRQILYHWATSEASHHFMESLQAAWGCLHTLGLSPGWNMMFMVVLARTAFLHNEAMKENTQYFQERELRPQ